MEYILEVVNQDYVNVYFLVIDLTGVVNFSGAEGGQYSCSKNYSHCVNGNSYFEVEFVHFDANTQIIQNENKTVSPKNN